MKTPFLFVLASFVAAAVAAPESRESAVEAAFAELRTLKSMQPGMRYTLPAEGPTLTGVGDDFLRRRTAAEIRESGLSCGCGDYALVFIDRMKTAGFETLLVDSAQISSISLANTYSGHAVVAIRRDDAPAAPWWLVDSTARTILSRNWSPQAKSFNASGYVYWIGYCGPAEDYPAHTPGELRQFYRDTLAKVPAETFNRLLYRFRFTVDPSLRDESGALLNPRVERLAREQAALFAQYRIKPEREVAILLTRGANDASGDLKLLDNQWVSRIGLKSACSPSLLSYYEAVVRRSEPAGEQ